MAEIILEGISKQFGATEVVRDISLQLPDKEFVVLLGPSGSGKSTILRMIAGLEKPSAGKIYIGERRVDALEPKDRNIAFVFQTYALYPHMSVRRNIAFPLIMRHWKWYYHVPILSSFMNRHLENRPDIKAKVDRAGEILGLSDYMNRKPKQLSGGQRQRVAVGRAIVREPAAYLMDEPLSNLDAKLRSQMRSEIIKLYGSVQTTFVYVTHDQVEAMTMGTRIVVLHNGVIQQYDTPKRIFDCPANTFVAQFIGSPPMNILHCQVIDRERVRVSNVVFPLDAALSQMIDDYDLVGKEVLLGIRPERINLSSMADGHSLHATVTIVENLGLETLAQFSIDGTAQTSIVQKEGATLSARLPGYIQVRPGDAVDLSLDLNGASLFDLQNGKRFLARDEKS